MRNKCNIFEQQQRTTTTDAIHEIRANREESYNYENYTISDYYTQFKITIRTYSSLRQRQSPTEGTSLCCIIQ